MMRRDQPVVWCSSATTGSLGEEETYSFCFVASASSPGVNAPQQFRPSTGLRNSHIANGLHPLEPAESRSTGMGFQEGMQR